MSTLALASGAFGALSLFLHLASIGTTIARLRPTGCNGFVWRGNEMRVADHGSVA